MSVNTGFKYGRPGSANGTPPRPPAGSSHRIWSDMTGATGPGTKPSLRTRDVRIPESVREKYRKLYPPLPPR